MVTLSLQVATPTLTESQEASARHRAMESSSCSNVIPITSKVLRLSAARPDSGRTLPYNDYTPTPFVDTTPEFRHCCQWQMREQTAAITRLIALSSSSPNRAPTVTVPENTAPTVIVPEFLGPQAAARRSLAKFANPGASLHASPYALNS